MAGKSKFLESVLERAQELLCEDGKEVMNADYFVLALVDKINGGEGEDDPERQEVVRLLGGPIVAGEELRASVKELPETRRFLFDVVRLQAEAIANKAGKAFVTADVYLDILLKNPTDMMKRLLGKKEPEHDEELSEFLDSILSDSAEEEEKKEEKPSEPAKPLTPEEGRAEHRRILGETKRIRDALLDTVYGQDNAVEDLISAYYRSELSTLTQERGTRPRASFLFAGPPGVGKTFLAEQAAKQLGLPFRCFDMSEYSDNESNLVLCGMPPSYKSACAGVLTGFVQDTPHCVLLIDEVEKAHLNTIHLFLQVLDAGRLRDNFTDKEVSFADAIIIFTTNAGRTLYEDPSIENLSCLSRKTVLSAISKERNPETNAPFFPAAICSRFASGNVMLFNRLGAHHLLRIIDREFTKQCVGLKEKTGVEISIGEKVPYALMFAEGGNADARMVRGRSGNFIYSELYELYRLLASEENSLEPENIRTIRFDVELPENEHVRALFEEDGGGNILLFADGERAKKCKRALSGMQVLSTGDLSEAKEILKKRPVKLILLDIRCNERRGREVLNREDADSAGREFLLYAMKHTRAPLFLLRESEEEIGREELLSFTRTGARGALTFGAKSFAEDVRGQCLIADQQSKLLELSKANRVLTFQTAQRVSADGTEAFISLYDLKEEVAPDAEDKRTISASRPAVRFENVIGAKDAKEELGFFVEYLKDPMKFSQKGMRPPRGVLLYGPPGTGKTLLAKALAGESKATFLAEEGNAFLKKYVGEGPEMVHNLFATARKYAPAVLFVDEIDAIALERGSEGATHTGDVLTAFLTEMDGFETEPGRPVFVLAATNVDLESGSASRRGLDPALLRRFDRRILVDLPDKSERMEYLRMKAEKNQYLRLGDEQIENIAMRSTGMSLADLESVIELALRNAFRTEDGYATDEIFEEAFETYNSGEKKHWDSSLLLRTARHEAGHALVCYLGGETPSYLTVVARASHGGYMQHANEEEKSLYTREELLAKVRTSLGGRAAELVCYGDAGASTGASGDLASATRLVEQMLCTYGMDDKIGLSAFNMGEIVSSSYYKEVRARVNEILNEQLEETKELLTRNREALERLAKALLEKDHLKGKEIEAIIKGERSA